MFGIDTEKLIKAVKIRSALYNKKEILYYSLKHKDKLWREIAEEIYGNWNQLSQLHKVEFVREIQKRWKSLRASFAREVAMQKKENIKRETGQNVKRRKTYEYFNKLHFLMNTTDGGEETRDSDDSPDPFDSSSEPGEMISDNGESSSDAKNVHTMKIETIPEQNYPQPQIVCERNNTLEEKVLDMLKDIKTDKNDEDRPTDGNDETRDSDDSADPLDSRYQPKEMICDYGEPSSNVKNVHTTKIETIPEQNYPKPQLVLKDIKKDEDDEDRQFMLSLVPTYRKLNAKQKLTARIEILKVLHNISFEQI